MKKVVITINGILILISMFVIVGLGELQINTKDLFYFLIFYIPTVILLFFIHNFLFERIASKYFVHSSYVKKGSYYYVGTSMSICFSTLLYFIGYFYYELYLVSEFEFDKTDSYLSLGMLAFYGINIICSAYFTGALMTWQEKIKLEAKACADNLITKCISSNEVTSWEVWMFDNYCPYFDYSKLERVDFHKV